MADGFGASPGVLVFYELVGDLGWTIFLAKADPDGDGMRDAVRIQR